MKKYGDKILGRGSEISPIAKAMWRNYKKGGDFSPSYVDCPRFNKEKTYVINIETGLVERVDSHDNLVSDIFIVRELVKSMWNKEGTEYVLNWAKSLKKEQAQLGLAL